MNKNIYLFILTVLGLNLAVSSGPRKDLQYIAPRTIIKAQVPLEENSIQSFWWNTGVFNQDQRTVNKVFIILRVPAMRLYLQPVSICANFRAIESCMGSYNGEMCLVM